MILLLATLAAAQTTCGTAFTSVAVRTLDARRALLVNQTVFVTGGRIAAVGPVGAIAVPTCARRIDGAGLTLSPGLHDLHVHIEDRADLTRFLAAGVTTIVNMSGSPRHLGWSAAIEAGELVGPHLRTTGPMLDTVDDPLFGLTVAVPDAASAEAAVRSQAASGYHLVKIHGALSVAAWEAAVRTAREVGTRVVGHVPEAVGLERVLASGPLTIEHAEEVMLGAFADGLRADAVTGVGRSVAASGVAVTPTLVAVHTIADTLAGERAEAPADLGLLARAVWSDGNNPYLRFYTPAEVATFPARVALQGHLVRALHRAGAPLLVGTDAGWVPWVIPGESVHAELAILEGLGIPREDVLAGATGAAGALLGTGAGVVAVGAPADLVLTDGDPALDPRAYARAVGTMVGGRWHDRATLRPPPTEIGPAAAALAAGDAEGALREAERALRSGALTPDEAHVLALALARLGHPGLALALVKANAAAHPESWDAHLGLARISALTGETLAARTHRREALRGAPPAARAAVRAIFSAPM